MSNAIFVTTDSDVKKVIENVLRAESTASDGKATYLRSLVAGVQIQLGGKPLLKRVPHRPKSATVEDARAALETVHSRFYALVLAALPQDMPMLERNAKATFARSAASTFRKAITLGLNPNTLAIPEVTKASLRAYAAEHRVAKPIDVQTGLRTARSIMHQLAEILEPLEQDEKVRVLEQVRKELVNLEAVVEYEPEMGAHRRTHIIPPSTARGERRVSA